MRLVATQAYPYGRKALKAGDLFDADEDDARLLCGFGKARRYVRQTEEPKAETPKKWQRGGRYNRSDVRASD